MISSLHMKGRNVASTCTLAHMRTHTLAHVPAHLPYLHTCALGQVPTQALAHLRMYLHTCANTCIGHSSKYLHINAFVQILAHLRTCGSSCTLTHLSKYLRKYPLAHLKHLRTELLNRQIFDFQRETHSVCPVSSQI